MALNNLGDVTDSGTLLANTTAIVNGATTASTSVVISAANSSIFIGQTVSGPGVQQANGIVGPTTITAISADGLTLTLSNPATFVSGAVLTFSSVYTPVTYLVVNGAVSNSTSITISASNPNVAVGQLISTQYALGASTVPTAPIFVSAISGTTLTVNVPVTISDKANITVWTAATPNVAVDFVWKNLPIQPNDDRNASNVANSGGAGVQNVYITNALKSFPGTIVFTTNAAHGLNVGDTISTGTYATSGTPFGSALTTVSNTAGTPNFIYTNSPSVAPQVGMVLVATAGTGTFAPGANVIVNVDTTAKTFTVAAAPTVDFSGATVIPAGQPVYSTTATINAGTKDTTLLTTACTTSATHYIAPGTPVILSSTTPAGYGTSPNGSYTALAVPDKTHITLSTQSTSFVTNNIGSKDAVVTSLAALTAATVTYYPFDVKEVRVIGVPSTTTFVVASTNGWSGDSTDSGIGAQSSLTGSLALVGDDTWADTTKAASARLDNGSINTTRNYLNYSTPTYDTYAMAAYGTFPNFIPGKFAVPSVTATTNYIVYSSVNNLTTSNTLNVSGISNPAFNQSGATIVAVKGDTIVTSNPSTSATGSTSGSSNLVTLTASNNAIKVGMSITSGASSGTPKVVAVSGAVVTLDIAQSLSSASLTFKVNPGTTLKGEYGVASAANFGVGSYIVSAASGNGTTITYTAQNNLVPSDVVNITGLANGAFNLSSATVASANATSFTVTNSGGSGVTLTGQNGKVEYASASSSVDGGFVSGTYYPQIPSIVGLTVTAAKDAFSDRGLTGIAASAVTTGITTSTDNAASTNTTLTITTANLNIFPGMLVTGTGVTTGTKIVTASADGKTFTVNQALNVSANATLTYSGTPVTTTPKGNGAVSTAFARVAGSNVIEITAVEAISGVVATGSGNTVTRASGTAITNVKVGQTIASTTITPARNITGVNYSTGAIAFDGAAVGTVTTETLTITGHGFVTGDQVIVSGGDATVNGDQTVIVKDASTVLINTSSTAAYSGTTALTLTGKAAYVHAQAIAAGTQSLAASTPITYSVWG